MTHDIEHTTARVIAIAREDWGLSAAALDYHVATKGIGRGHGDIIQNAIYRVANEGASRDEEHEATMERSRQLREAIQPALDRYEARCKSRRYVGWSGSGPVRYADAP